MTPQENIPYRRLFPWLHLFRAIRLAFSLRQLLVAGGAIFALWLGDAAIERFYPANELVDRLLVDVAELSTPPIGFDFQRVTEFEVQQFGSSSHSLTSEMIMRVGRPWRDVVRPALTALNSGITPNRRWRETSRFLWSVATWSLLGIALSRLAARRFAHEEGGSVRQSLRFGVTRWRHGIAAPLIPLAAALILWLITIVASLPGGLPVVGTIYIVIASPGLLICGLIAAFLSIAVILGWPLMLAAIACDDCDGFGGLSRSYSLWTGRPWHYVWYIIVAAAAGVAGLFLAIVLATFAGNLTATALSTGLAEGRSLQSAKTACEWLLRWGLSAYAISYFWTSATIAYVLLRQCVDGVPLDTIAPNDNERPARDPLPVVGMPAVSQPEAPPTSA